MIDLRKYLTVGIGNLGSSAVSFAFVALISRSGIDPKFADYFVFLILYNMFTIPGIYTISNSIVKKTGISFFALLFVIISIVYYGATYQYLNSLYFLPSVATFFFGALFWSFMEGYARATESFVHIATSRLAGVLINGSLSLVLFLNDSLTFDTFLIFRGVEFWVAASILLLRMRVNIRFDTILSTTFFNPKPLAYFFVFFLSTVPGNVDKLVLNLTNPDASLVGLYNKYAFAVYVFTGRIFEIFVTVFFVRLVAQASDIHKPGKKHYSKMTIASFLVAPALLLMFGVSIGVLWFINAKIELLVLALVCVQAALFFYNQYTLLESYAKDQLGRIRDFWPLAASAFLFTVYMAVSPLEGIVAFVVPSIFYNFAVLVWLHTKIRKKDAKA